MVEQYGAVLTQTVITALMCLLTHSRNLTMLLLLIKLLSWETQDNVYLFISGNYIFVQI